MHPHGQIYLADFFVAYIIRAEEISVALSAAYPPEHKRIHSYENDGSVRLSSKINAHTKISLCAYKAYGWLCNLALGLIQTFTCEPSVLKFYYHFFFMEIQRI